MGIAMDLGIDGKLAVVTGGAGEIRGCAAHTLAFDGAQIISSDTNEQELSDAVASLRDDIGVDVFSAVAELRTSAGPWTVAGGATCSVRTRRSATPAQSSELGLRIRRENDVAIPPTS